jgi:hypothetical protein
LFFVTTLLPAFLSAVSADRIHPRHARRQVATGREDDRAIEIVSGLFAGEAIAISSPM